MNGALVSFGAYVSTPGGYAHIVDAGQLEPGIEIQKLVQRLAQHVDGSVRYAFEITSIGVGRYILINSFYSADHINWDGRRGLSFTTWCDFYSVQTLELTSPRYKPILKQLELLLQSVDEEIFEIPMNDGKVFDYVSEVRKLLRLADVSSEAIRGIYVTEPTVAAQKPPNSTSPQAKNRWAGLESTLTLAAAATAITALAIAVFFRG